MIGRLGRWLGNLPLRIRLSVWYVLLLGFALTLFSGYLLLQLERSQVTQLQVALEVTAGELVSYVKSGEDPTFQQSERFQRVVRRFVDSGMAARLVSPTGETLDGFGHYQTILMWGAPSAGYSQRLGDDTQWYIYTQPLLPADAGAGGWLQVMHSLDSVHQAAEDFSKQILVSLPVVLLLAGLSGLFLADRALRPIDRITRMASGISASQLSQRMDYRGPADEVGRLAKTFDRMLDDLQSAFERERRFVADASHELRTPLTVMKGQIEVVLSQPRSPMAYEKTLRSLSQEVNRLHRLTQALLFLARMDQHQLRWHPAPLELSQLLSAVGEQLRPLAASRQVTLSERLPLECYVQGDADLLIRVFFNLLDNAVNHTSKGGCITLWIRVEGAQICVGIHNTGGGISPECLPHLFERFYRVESARSRQTGGTGLGLAIAQEIVRLHGGKIAVESNLQQGTTFTVCLPAA